MYKVVICIILLLTLVRQMRSDEGLSHILPNKDVFEVAPKIWHMYIKTYLYKLISKSQLFTVEEIFYHLNSDMNIFSKYSQDRLLKPVQPNYTLIVTRASGRLDLVDVGIFVYYAEKKFYLLSPYLPHVAYTWILQMDVRLRVHLKFGSIYFPLSPYDCMKGNITISQNSLHFSTFIFCGQMAMLFLYPSSPKINIKLSVMDKILYKVKMSYMVMDNNQIETTKGNFNSSEVLYSSVSIREKIRVISYFIQVQKTQKIVLNITNANYSLLFDGPGYSSEVIQKRRFLTPKNKEYYMTTTFQCLLQILTFSNMITPETAYFDFFGIYQTLHTINISNKIANIEIPSNIYNNMPFIFYIKVPSEQYVNITILHQSYKGQRTMDCKYGGIAFIENTDHVHNEVATICESHNNIISHNRNIFSHSSSLIIVAYWYKNYSNMSVSLNVTSTICRPIQFDVCKFQIRCQSHYNMKHCLEYVGPIFKSVNISHNYQLLKSELQYSLRENQCVIFQFTQNLKYNTIYEKGFYHQYLSHCHLKIKASTFQKPGYILNYMFKGSSRHNQSDKMWHISFRGLNDKFCHKIGMTENTHCVSKICSKINCFDSILSIFSMFRQKYNPFYKISNKTNGTEFLIHVETKTPTFDTSFYFELNFARWTQGWINVMVWVTKALYTSRVQYPTEVIQIKEKRIRIKSVIGNPNSIFYLNLNSSKITRKMHIFLALAMYSVIEHRPWRYYEKLELLWRSCFKLSNMFKTQPVSIPGSVSRISVDMREIHNNITSKDKLEALWVKDKQSIYNNLSPKYLKKSYCMESVKEQKECNYSSYADDGYFINKYYYLFESRSTKMTGGVVGRLYTKLWSWKDADKLCRDIGGQLPYFLSREELTELTDFLKNSPHILPYEAMYVGMTLNSTQKVNSFISRFPYIKSKLNLINSVYYICHFSLVKSHHMTP